MQYELALQIFNRLCELGSSPLMLYKATERAYTVWVADRADAPPLEQYKARGYVAIWYVTPRFFEIFNEPKPPYANFSWGIPYQGIERKQPKKKKGKK
jgi:hypothetical protein